MYKLSFKVKHKGCHETAFSAKFPNYHVTVVDIQVINPKQKQYFYYINGDRRGFDAIFSHLKKSKGYELVKEIERTNDTLMLLVVLYQKSYIQNVIQKYNGFFLDLHTCYGGYEYWHIGTVHRESIDHMLGEFRKMGELKVIFIGEMDFAHTLLSKQQKAVFLYAFEHGYYEMPRKITIERIAKAMRKNHATIGEHLLKAENRIITSMARRL